MNERSSDYVLIDEAAQAAEVECIAPLSQLNIGGGCCLLGDHKQLPTVALCQWHKQKYERSLFERMYQLKLLGPTMLNIQYRMHDSIAKFPSEEFYESRLLSARSLCSAPDLIRGFCWPHESALAFVHHRGTEDYHAGSYANRAEIDLISHVLETILQAGDVIPEDMAAP